MWMVVMAGAALLQYSQRALFLFSFLLYESEFCVTVWTDLAWTLIECQASCFAFLIMSLCILSLTCSSLNCMCLLWFVTGFNTLIDLTYPLTSQSILSDGRRWRFTAYQLNTLELWKDNKGNEHANLCWASEEAELFAGVEAGKVGYAGIWSCKEKGLSRRKDCEDLTLKLLAKMFCKLLFWFIQHLLCVCVCVCVCLAF
jgi:hypothetical protein